jgi:hypothetical protein
MASTPLTERPGCHQSVDRVPGPVHNTTVKVWTETAGNRCSRGAAHAGHQPRRPCCRLTSAWHGAGVAFPWTNFITAMSTLIAALGGASLTAVLSSRAEGRRLTHMRRAGRADLRSEAYTDFVRIARADARILGIAGLQFAHSVPSDERARQMIREASDLVETFNGAHARVEIVGSEQAADSAGQVATAARKLGARFSEAYLYGQAFAVAEATTELNELWRTIDGFAATCRGELTDPE